MPTFHPLGRVVGDFNPELLGDPVNELLPFRNCKTVSDARAILRERVEEDGVRNDLLGHAPY